MEAKYKDIQHLSPRSLFYSDICDSKAILKVIISIAVLVFVQVAKHLSVLLILFTLNLNIALFGL